MFLGRTDAVEGLAVWLFAPGPNTEVDWQNYCQAIRKSARETSTHATPCAFQVIESGSEDPSAKWRGEIAEALKSVMPSSHIVLVTSSNLVRHMLTAIFWVRPPKFTVSVEPTEEAGLEKLNLARPHAAIRARAILADLRGSRSRLEVAQKNET